MIRLKEALPVWIKIGLLSFGGPAGQIALMQDEVVTRRGWIAADSFDKGLAFSMMLPGPEAQQLATWLGWRLHGVLGGLIAGLAFILPGAVLMIALAWGAAAHGDVPIVSAIFGGVQPVVIALVLAALAKIAGRALKGPVHYALALAAFSALWWLGVPFPAVVAAAAVIGLMLPDNSETSDQVSAASGIWRHAAVTLGIAIGLISIVWTANNAMMTEQPFRDVPVLFTTAAFATFGGAYAVLPFVAGQAVEVYGWLTADSMLNGLAIAEATPGPLILVNTYTGFFAGWSVEQSTSGGVYAAAMATFFAFAPSFALILAFAPAVERISDIPWARRALAGISAAVVGVILNLAFFLGEAAFLPTGIDALVWTKIVLFLLALPAVFVFRLGMVSLIGGGIAAGVALHFAGLL